MQELFLAAGCLPVVFSTHAYGLFKMLAKISLIWVYSCCSADAMDCCIMIAERNSLWNPLWESGNQNSSELYFERMLSLVFRVE